MAGDGGHAGDVTIATEFPELLALIEVMESRSTLTSWLM
jgi:hypothetical protein